MKLWLKLIKDDKIVAHYVVENTAPLLRDEYEDALREGCYHLDIACPLLMECHYRHIKNFNIAKYLSSEFCEDVNFDFMTVEYIHTKKKETKNLDFYV